MQFANHKYLIFLCFNFAGQQNIPMPPRPSSGQSDSGSTSSQSRLSHSPMAPTQGKLTFTLSANTGDIFFFAAAAAAAAGFHPMKVCFIFKRFYLS